MGDVTIGNRILGVAKLEVHPATDVLQFEHRASPSGTSDGDLHGAGAKFGVAEIIASLRREVRRYSSGGGFGFRAR